MEAADLGAATPVVVLDIKGNRVPERNVGGKRNANYCRLLNDQIRMSKTKDVAPRELSQMLGVSSRVIGTASTNDSAHVKAP